LANRVDPARPVIVTAVDFEVPDGPPTPGMHRKVALEHEGVWVGTVDTEPGVMTGWHHHGDWDTYVYTLRGDARLDYVDGREVVVRTTRPGEVIFIPKGVVHREGSASTNGIGALLVRVGSGPIVIHVADEDVPATD
jgi:uncharacterized RmlC-like cupin family protein